MENIREKLNQLAQLRQQWELAVEANQTLRDKVLTPKVRRELAALERELKSQLDPIDQETGQLEADIRAEVLRHGQTVQGESLMAVFVNGRISWNNDALAGYAVSHPEILQWRKQGQPAVAIKSRHATQPAQTTE